MLAPALDNCTRRSEGARCRRRPPGYRTGSDSRNSIISFKTARRPPFRLGMSELDLHYSSVAETLTVSPKIRHQTPEVLTDARGDFIMPTPGASMAEWSDMSETLSSVSGMSSDVTDRTIEGHVIEHGESTVDPETTHSPVLSNEMN